MIAGNLSMLSWVETNSHSSTVWRNPATTIPIGEHPGPPRTHHDPEQGGVLSQGGPYEAR